jgi:hypothetical protein
VYTCTHSDPQLSVITCDNDSKNNTFMDKFADLLKAEGIPFDRDGNRIQYVLLRVPSVRTVTAASDASHTSSTSQFNTFSPL